MSERPIAPAEWALEYFRSKLAEHPAEGYVTSEQARARVAEGATWMEAVRPVEAEENTCRKAFTPTEAESIARAREEWLVPLAEQAKAHGQTAPGRPNASAKFAEASPAPVRPAADQQTRKLAANGTGYSPTTLAKVRAVEFVHLILVPVDGPAGPQCGGTGRAVMRREEVTCPDCRAIVGGAVEGVRS
ncbi:hypothetical protein GCM10010468_37220 [Actinocorallia longicatena]|uniref:Uncharacterized protein n=1 Tax=Actinocorallia longicatena TaxID=111803 RepID=A0ABP6QAH3_9ACTN